MEEALFLTRYATQVHLIHRRDAFRASKIMQRRVVEHPKISIHYNTEVTDVLGENVVGGVQLRDTQTGATSALPVQGSSWLSATSRTPASSRASWRWTSVAT